MKKIFLLLLSILFSSLSIGSTDVPPELFIFESVGIQSYDPLIRAIFIHESGGNQFAINQSEMAVGPGQVRQCRVDHYNNLMGTSYQLEDFFSYELTEEMFVYFTCHDGNGNEIEPKSYEMAARDWNGSGPMTIEYWNKVKTLL
jgi:hypothetical protein